MRLPKEQVSEWFENETTVYFFSLIERLKKDAVEELADQGFDTDTEDKLIGRRSHLWGIRNTMEDLEQVFETRSLSKLEEDDEPIGNSPERRQGTDTPD